VAWLEQQLMEHGPLTWSALEQAMAEEPWHAQARAWVDAADPGEEQDFGDLQRVMHRLWIARLGEEAQRLAAAGTESGEPLLRLRALHEQIGRLKALLAAPGG
jgi:hypothetical protein